MKEHLREKATFIFVGGLCATAYMVLASVFVNLGVSVTSASPLAYGMCVPLGYLGHRTLTFRSNANHRTAAIAYLSTQGVALGVAAAVTFVMATLWHQAPAPSFFAAATAAAISSYFMQSRWVF